MNSGVVHVWWELQGVHCMWESNSSYIYVHFACWDDEPPLWTATWRMISSLTWSSSEACWLLHLLADRAFFLCWLSHPHPRNIWLSEANILTWLIVIHFGSLEFILCEKETEPRVKVHQVYKLIHQHLKSCVIFTHFLFFLLYFLLPLTWWSNNRRWGSEWRQRCLSQRWPCICWEAGPGRWLAAWCTTCWSKPVQGHRSTLNKDRGRILKHIYRKSTAGSGDMC